MQKFENCTKQRAKKKPKYERDRNLHEHQNKRRGKMQVGRRSVD